MSTSPTAGPQPQPGAAPASDVTEVAPEESRYASWTTDPAARPLPTQQPPLPAPAYPGSLAQQPPPGYPVPAPVAAAPVAERVRRVFASPLLLLVSTLLVAAGTMLPWYRQLNVRTTSGGIQVDDNGLRNGWQQATIVVGNSPVMGGLMLAALAIASVCALLLLVATLMGFISGARKGVGVLALATSIILTVACLGMLVGWVLMGAVNHALAGLWVFGLSFVPAVVGSIGLLTRKF